MYDPEDEDSMWNDHDEEPARTEAPVTQVVPTVSPSTQCLVRGLPDHVRARQPSVVSIVVTHDDGRQVIMCRERG